MRIEERFAQREALMDLLLLADPSVEMVRTYLDRGRLFVLCQGDEAIGVLHLDPVDDRTAEIRNVAIREHVQGKGYGQQLLARAVAAAREDGFCRLIVSTGNSSIGNLAFYQKGGFRMVAIEPDYFVRLYSAPIYEHGIQCRDRIQLERIL